MTYEEGPGDGPPKGDGTDGAKIEGDGPPKGDGTDGAKIEGDGPPKGDGTDGAKIEGDGALKVEFVEEGPGDGEFIVLGDGLGISTKLPLD